MPHEGLGLIAAANAGGVIAVASPTGDVRARISAEGPFGWSPSGRWLATDDGRLWDPNGEQQERLFPTGKGAWVWSPVADCAIKATPKGLLVGRPGQRASLFARPGDLGGEPLSLLFSEDGERLAVVASTTRRSPGLVMVELGTGGIERLVSPDPQVGVLEPVAWQVGGTKLVYVSAPDSDALGAGQPLMSISTVSLAAPVVFATQEHPEDAHVDLTEASLQTCGPELIGVIDGDTVVFRERSDPRVIAADHSTPACSGDGAYIVAVAGGTRGTLELLRANGERITRLSPDDGLQDMLPTWGPPRTGVVFVRVDGGDTTGEIWFSQEGKVPAPTKLGVDTSAPTPFDWSADGPG